VEYHGELVYPNSELLMCRKFTHIFTTNFVDFLDIRASREVFPIGVPIGVRSPEIKERRKENA
jgi:hypothetical protein